jgi:hypothetical protein
MKTDVQTPQVLFMLPQRLVVPLFQRPYVWNEENQWAPLWRDVERVAERQLSGTAAGQPHFLGAVVLQQMQAPPGTLQVWTIIDGQQRLTTLQLLFDALHAELVAVGAVQPALRLEPLVTNPSAFCHRDADRFKVWPTNRDRPAFNEVMPRHWQAHWPLGPGVSEAERDQLVHTLGNLTLLTSSLNSKVSNGPWSDKKVALRKHDVLKMDSNLLDQAGDAWTDDKIKARTKTMAAAIIEIWPVPAGHRSEFGRTAPEPPTHYVSLFDLIGSGLLTPGTTLYARRRAHAHRTATVLADGRIDIDGNVYDSPSGAAKAITGKQTNGWKFFLVEPGSTRTLRSLLQDYAEQTTTDIEEDALEDDEEET